MNFQNIYKCQKRRFFSYLWMKTQNNEKVRLLFIRLFRPYYVKLRYLMVTGTKLDYNNCVDIEQKLHWLLAFSYWKNPLVVQCADKLRVRDYVKSRGCGDILNELYFSYNDIEKVNIEELPNQFVFKSNNSTGTNVFCYDKSKLDKESFFKTVFSWGTKPSGVCPIEFQYFKIKYALICEKLLVCKHQELMEYQFFCFNGEPESILVRNDLDTLSSNPIAVTYSIDWSRLHYRINEDQFTEDIQKPIFLEKMIDYAKKLAEPFPHVRVDFYGLGDTLVFGEMTFTTHGCLLSNYKDSVKKKWGDLIVLPNK